MRLSIALWWVCSVFGRGTSRRSEAPCQWRGKVGAFLVNGAKDHNYKIPRGRLYKINKRAFCLLKYDLSKRWRESLVRPGFKTRNHFGAICIGGNSIGIHLNHFRKAKSSFLTCTISNVGNSSYYAVLLRQIVGIFYVFRRRNNTKTLEM